MPNYTTLDKILHIAILSSNIIGEMLFDIECALFKKKLNTNFSNQGTVYITGLARSGTTILMREVYASGKFSSLTYDDMPFVMAPNLWQKLTARNKTKRITTVRAHGDRIKVNSDSPEALEEVFWKTYQGHKYIKPHFLESHDYDKEFNLKLNTYQALICNKHGKNRYLSKNNNHILRLKSLAKNNQESKILILFRDPIEQSYSLQKQHIKFSDSPSFTKQYMEWLVHHEFGSTHRPFKFNSYNERKHIDESSLDYWLEIWINSYTHILRVMNENHPNTILISYERMCTDIEYWKKICKLIDIPINNHCSFSIEPKELDLKADNNLINSAKNLYQQLDKCSLEKLSLLSDLNDCSQNSI